MEFYHKYIPTSVNGEPVTVPLFCDGLSCETGESSKKARTNGEDGWARLSGLEPSIQDWHLRLLQLQDTYSELFRISREVLEHSITSSRNMASKWSVVM